MNESKLRANTSQIKTIISSLNLIYNEINEYNTSYWSKYLLSIWLFQGTVIINTLYFILFIPMLNICKYIFIWIEIVFIVTFLLIISTASSVNYEVNKSYKLLNSVMAHSVRNIRIFKPISYNN